MRLKSSRSVRFVKFMAAGVIAAGLLSGLTLPRAAYAHWGMCFDDPKVWLDDGSKFDMNTSIQADTSAIAHLSFTLHVPPGTNATRVVRTAGVSGSFESVDVVANSAGGYWVDLVAQSSDGSTHQVSLTVHIVHASSTWVSATGVTDQDVLACLSTCAGG